MQYIKFHRTLRIANLATLENTEAQTDPLEIIYQDADYVAIHKPAGLLVHHSPLDK